jgi:hypothetical protein
VVPREQGAQSIGRRGCGRLGRWLQFQHAVIRRWDGGAICAALPRQHDELIPRAATGERRQKEETKVQPEQEGEGC